MIGVYTNSPDAARLTHAGLWALQHRGQESSGIASLSGNIIRVYKNQGLVASVYDEEHLSLLAGHSAIGHNRYATSGGKGIEHAQPIFHNEDLVALAHNGNLPSTQKIEKLLHKLKIDIFGLNDSEMMQKAINYYLHDKLSLEKALKIVLPYFTGVYSLVLLTREGLFAIRDPHGIRPLSLGKVNGTYIISSETCALDTLGAEFIRDIKPGELIRINAEGINSTQLLPGKEHLDVFEFIYFARSDSILLGKRVDEVRKNLGKQLAQEVKVKLDVVIPVPDSGISATLGFSAQTQTPFDHGLIKNRYINRTFIQPAQKLREDQVKLKLIPIPEVLKGKKVGVVDDSIVRGTTAKSLVALLRKAGAKEVHLLITSPPVRYPDFYGIDTPKQKDLIAFNHNPKEIAKLVNANSVQFLSLTGLKKALGKLANHCCMSCLTGEYPVSIRERKNEVCSISI